MIFSWHDPAQLAAEIRSLPPLDNDAVAQADGDFLVDACIPGAPLLISFAFVDWDKPADFYLFGRSKKLEQLSGKALNRILLRDRGNLWYLRGVPGLGENPAQVLQRLQQLIGALQPGAVWCIGESMGGFGAIMHGLLLQAERIVSFGALSSFSPRFAEQYGDRRWLGSMTGLGDAPNEDYDLPELARKQGYRGRLHLIQGSSGGPDAPDTVNLDVMHSRRYSDLRCVRFHDYPEAVHAVTHWLAQNERFDALLMHCLFDGPDPAPLPLPAAPRVKAVSAENVSWPAQFPSLSPERIAVADRDILVHSATPRATLLICFADAAPEGVAAGFDAYDERAAMEQAIGKPLNQLLLRDSRNQAWLRGCLGLGDDAESMAMSLRKLIARIEPGRIICCGQGVGGFAALLFAELLAADAVLAFDPLTVLDARQAECWHDRRYRHILDAIDGAAATAGPRDLLPILRRYRGRAHIMCSALGSGSMDAGSHAAVHAQRIAMLPCVQVSPLPCEGNALQRLREHKLIVDALCDIVG